MQNLVADCHTVLGYVGGPQSYWDAFVPVLE